MKNFEERITRLEDLTEELQSGHIPLEEAITLFEEGITISKRLEKELSKIERKIEVLINNPISEEDQPELELFEAAPGLDE